MDKIRNSFNLFLFIKNKPLFISSEGFSEGNAADPVGRDSPLQLEMAVLRTFFLNLNLLGFA
jgi:hypothetical protein